MEAAAVEEEVEGPEDHWDQAMAHLKVVDQSLLPRMLHCQQV